MNVSLRMKDDPETDKAFGWVLEMCVMFMFLISVVACSSYYAWLMKSKFDLYFLVPGMAMQWHLLYMVYATFFERTSCYRSARAELKYLFLHYVMLD